MPKPSVFRQVEATSIAKNSLKESPRHWNNGLFRYRGRLWMSYRFHLMTASGRCKTAICPIDEKTLQPSGPSQMLMLPENNGDEHQEDARLFLFKDQPYVSYTAMVGYRPGVDFKCVMKYARLSLTGTKWKVEDDWCPRYGRNDWRSKEKNWVFFESAGRLHAVYSGDQRHVVIELEGDKVVQEYHSAPPVWEWGIFRGGTPPLLMPDGTFMSVFHSSIPTEMAPHYVRYFAGAYKFLAHPPFKIVGISPRPFLAGSEEDGHEVDPRYVDGWKPYVVFPCGLVESGKNMLISFGINDWQSAIARMPTEKFTFVSPDGTQKVARYFKKQTANQPVRLLGSGNQYRMLTWSVPVPGPACSAGIGYMKVVSHRDAEEISELQGVVEISEGDFHVLNRAQSSSCLSIS